MSNLPGVLGDVAPYIDDYGYAAVGGFLFLKNVGIPVPGGPDALVPEQRPVPVPGEDEVLIRVAAAGVPVVPGRADPQMSDEQLAAAVANGRLMRLADGIYVQPIAPARAMRVLAALPQPFTTSQARQALDTTRRVAIPLLEHLDARGWTRRIDFGHREIAR